MNRRTAVKNLFIIAGGLALLPSCLREEGGASIVLNRLKVTSAQEELLADLVEALIPETDSPGAKTLNLHLFVLKMVDDCHSPEEQKLFMEGLKKLREEEKDFVIFWENESGAKGSDFAKIVKRRSIQGYLNSEYVMTNKLIYELVPGRYNGALKIDRVNG